MSISINPIFPVIAAQGAAPDVVLQPGTVIDAEVLKLLSDDLVRIAISGLSIEVFSEIPLQVGQALQLAVSQTPDGIRLAVVGQESGTRAVVSADAATLAPDTIVDVVATPPVGAPPPINQPSRNELTPLERAAVAAAVESAATRQESLAPLFANLDAVAASNALPPKAAAGRDASAGAAHQPRSNPERQRRQECLSKIRTFPGGFAGVGSHFVAGRHARSQGRTDRASSDAVVLARRNRELPKTLPRTRRPRSSLFCRGLPSFPPWMPRRGRSRRNRSRRRLLSCRPLKQQLRRMLRRQQRLPHRLPKSRCRKFCCRRRACRLRMTLLSLAAPIRIVLPETPDAGRRAAATGAAFTLLQEVLPESPPEIA